MSLILRRTVSHFYKGGDESCLDISEMTYADGSKSLLVGNTDSEAGSISIHGKKQCADLIQLLEILSEKVFDDELDLNSEVK